MGIQPVISCLLNRGMSPDSETTFFKNLKHDEIINNLICYLNAHRHFLGTCRLQPTHALNDRGVDLLLITSDEKIGFQIKSDHDVSEDKFAANVKRQFAEALCHSLTHYFVLICAPMEERRSRIIHLRNEFDLFTDITFSCEVYLPNNLVVPFRDKPIVTRDELLLSRAITDEALHEYERGYEHLPEVTHTDIDNAIARYDEFDYDCGSPLFSKEMEALKELEDMVHLKQRIQFETDFYPTLPPEIKEKRDCLIKAARTVLQECRECASWDDKSEDKLASWIEHIPEEMIPYTSIPNLLLINDRLKKYYQIHLEMGNGGTP